MTQLNIIGNQYGELTVESINPERKNRSIVLDCKCSCGNKVSVEKRYLTSGRKTHCGNRKIHIHNKDIGKKYRAAGIPEEERVRNHPSYLRWQNIKRRCYNPNSKDYKNYGGRGICMHEKWIKRSRPFLEWLDKNLGPCPEKYTLDRINNDGNYVPGNLRWISKADQNRNRRSSSEWDI